MRIAIVTVYDSIINYGSFLQAYGLNEYLKSLGHDVYFVRRMTDEQIFERFNNALKKNTVSKGKKLRFIRQIKKNAINKIELKNNVERYAQSQKDWAALKFINKEDVNSENIDLIICGSDEIWNVNNVDIDVPFYACDWADDSVRKIAYAISSGNTRPEELDESLEKDFARFEYLLPRDNMTQKLFQKTLGYTNDIVCDPTILYGKKNFSVDTNNKYGKYILIYSYVLTRQEKKYLKRFAAERNLKILSACIYSDIADINVFTSALEFPSIINNAEYVYSTTFHGTIFSLMFAKHFVCKARLPKIIDILDVCGAKSVIFNPSYSYEQFVKLMDAKLDHDEIEANMEKLREFSRSRLNAGLSGDYEKLDYESSKNDNYPHYYMGITKDDDVRAKSSSGGIFHDLAQKVLDEGGVVFGAVYDSETQLVHHTNTDEVPLEKLMRSKYVDSEIRDSYSQVLSFLESGRKVLFAGTPCQAAGLRKLVDIKAKDKVDNLLIVDFLCEGVPSRNIFTDYQKMHEKRSGSRVSEVIFRSKVYGWVPHAMKVVFENGKEYFAPYYLDEYMHTFIHDLVFNRPSCYFCRFRSDKKSDVTLGDFWKVNKIDKSMNDNKGTSVIFANTEAGVKAIEAISDKLKITRVTDNRRFYMEQDLDPSNRKPKRDEFYKYYLENGFEKSIAKYSSYYKNSSFKKKLNYMIISMKIEKRRKSSK